MILPTEVTRSSLGWANRAVVASSCRMLRSFQMRNSRPLRPMRIWENSIGPGVFSFTARPAAKHSGSHRGNAASVKPMSVRRLTVSYAGLPSSAHKSWACRLDNIFRPLISSATASTL